MPVIKSFHNDHDFVVEQPETDQKYGFTIYVFLNKNIIVKEEHIDGDSMTEIRPMIVDEKIGIMVWEYDGDYWKPIHELVQKAYFSYLAEKSLLKE